MAEQAGLALCNLRVQGPRGWRSFHFVRNPAAEASTYRWGSLLLEFTTETPVDRQVLASLRRRYRRRVQRWCQDYGRKRASALLATFRRSLGCEMHRGLCQWMTTLELLSSWLTNDLTSAERREAEAELRELSLQMSRGVRSLYQGILDHPGDPTTQRLDPLLVEIYRMLQYCDPGAGCQVDAQSVHFSPLQRSLEHLEEVRRCWQFFSGQPSKLAQGELVMGLDRFRSG